PRRTTATRLAVRDALPISLGPVQQVAGEQREGEHAAGHRGQVAVWQQPADLPAAQAERLGGVALGAGERLERLPQRVQRGAHRRDRKSTRLNSSHVKISYA